MDKNIHKLNLTKTVAARQQAERDLELWTAQTQTARNLAAKYQSLAQLQETVCELRAYLIHEQALVAITTHSEAVEALETEGA